MTAQDFEARIVAWAGAQSDVEALVQIGSRVQPGAQIDSWSDWDYQLIVRTPAKYHNRDWPAQIAPCWSAHFERTERAVTKLSAVFADGWEADFVLLSAWQMKLVCFAMRHPQAQGWFPGALRRGICNFRLIAGPGHRVVLGGSAWEQRYAALSGPWPTPGFVADDFQRHTAAFWRHAVWVAKKILRGELRAAMRWSQVELRNHVYVLLAEEARLAGREPRPEARKAEKWLDERRLNQTAISTSLDQRSLARALLAELTLFEEVCRSVAESRGFAQQDYSAVAAWLRAELAKLTG
ncbi:MAG: aminoglycoside 6-adenylyltransferase [Opitutaceae bacterium]|nr:aminoglycoside 6-adenylyltransferase [Opitutaceae bacterium]